MKLTTTLITALVALSGHALASTLLIAVAEDTFFGYEGTPLGSEFSVTGGWYDVTLGLDYASISSNFITAGSISFPYGGNAAYNGYASGETAFFNANILGLEGRTVFWLVTDGSSAYALLEDTGVQFVLETAIPNQTGSSLNAGNLSQFTIHVGEANGTTSVGLAAIPETSTAFLGGLGALALLRRRRS